MAHSLASTAPAATPISTLFAKKKCNPVGSLRLPVACSDQCSGAHIIAAIDRRNVALGLAVAGAALSLNLLVGDKRATAAARRPPAGPPAEKKDPNISGLAAKIIASKKRKEAMKEAVAKQRQQGKAVVKQE